MKAEYLLYNNTAKRLYFECARDLPMILFRAVGEDESARYSSFVDAFLFSDPDKLSLMRECGVEARYLSGEASDFESFKMFCTVLPRCIGNPLYILSHIELSRLWGCDIALCEANCEDIWREVNRKIGYEELVLSDVLDRAGALRVPFLPIELASCSDVSSAQELDIRVRSLVAQARSLGCRLVISRAGSGFEVPNPYLVDRILDKRSQGERIDAREERVLEAQMKRTLGIECKREDMTLALAGETSDELIRYLDRSNALPRIAELFTLDIGTDIDTAEKELISYARRRSLGSAICVPKITGALSDIARQDYFRRVLSSVLGDIFEKGEYLESYESLCDIFRDIAYRNVKNIL